MCKIILRSLVKNFYIRPSVPSGHTIVLFLVANFAAGNKSVNENSLKRKNLQTQKLKNKI